MEEISRSKRFEFDRRGRKKTVIEIEYRSGGMRHIRTQRIAPSKSIGDFSRILHARNASRFSDQSLVFNRFIDKVLAIDYVLVDLVSSVVDLDKRLADESSLDYVMHSAVKRVLVSQHSVFDVIGTYATEGYMFGHDGWWDVSGETSVDVGFVSSSPPSPRPIGSELKRDEENKRTRAAKEKVRVDFGVAHPDMKADFEAMSTARNVLLHNHAGSSVVYYRDQDSSGWTVDTKNTNREMVSVTRLREVSVAAARFAWCWFITQSIAHVFGNARLSHQEVVDIFTKAWESTYERELSRYR